MLDVFLFRALYCGMKDLLQPKGKASVPHQSTASSTYLGSSRVGSENGAKSSLPWCVPATKESYSCEIWRMESHTVHLLFGLKNPTNQCWSCQIFRTCMVHKLLCTLFLGRTGGSVTTFGYSQTHSRVPCCCASHGEATNQNHSASALPYDVQRCKLFYCLGQRIFSLVPYSPQEFEVRARLQTSPSHGEELTYHKMNRTTQDRRNCLALSSFTYFSKHVLTKNERKCLYTQISDRPGWSHPTGYDQPVPAGTGLGKSVSSPRWQ